MAPDDSTERPWRRVASDPPPSRVVVEVQNNGGARLVYDSGLWWFPDRSMYVYYSPEFWRELPSAELPARLLGGDQ